MNALWKHEGGNLVYQLTRQQRRTERYREMIAESEADELVRLARCIADNQQLNLVLASAEPKLRRSVYQLLTPLLSFKPKPFCLLKF